jgi:hypothetical protein
METNMMFAWKIKLTGSIGDRIDDVTDARIFDLQCFWTLLDPQDATAYGAKEP